MKKLLKQEWKLYVGIFLITLYVLVQRRMHFDHAYDALTTEYLVPWMDLQIYELHQVVFFSIPQIILLFLLIRKALVFQIERSSYGREFLQTLPIKRMQRMKFHLVMDVLYVLLAVAAGFVINYIQLNQHVRQKGFDAPWLFESMLGEAVLVCCYLLFTLAFMNFWEMFFVDGTVRSIAVAGIFLEIFYLLLTARFLDHHPRYFPHKILTKIFSVNYLTICNDEGIYKPELYYHGNIVECPYSIGQQGYNTEVGSLFQMYKFSEMSTYIGYVIGYIALAQFLLHFPYGALKDRNFRKQDSIFLTEDICLMVGYA